MTDLSPSTALDTLARLGWHGFKTEYGQAAYGALEDIGRYFDDQVAQDIGDVDKSEPAKDRLFETLMARFDQLQTHRAAVISVWKAGFSDPGLMLLVQRALPKTMRRMLACAGLKSSGLEGMVKARVLGLIYLSAVRQWVQDDSPDMDATMAYLDKELSRIEPIGRRLFAHDEVKSE